MVERISRPFQQNADDTNAKKGNMNDCEKGWKSNVWLINSFIQDYIFYNLYSNFLFQAYKETNLKQIIIEIPNETIEPRAPNYNKVISSAKYPQ